MFRFCMLKELVSLVVDFGDILLDALLTADGEDDEADDSIDSTE